MDLLTAMRIGSPACIALVGGGGKTTTMFRLAREFNGPVLLTTTTHLGTDQIDKGDRHQIVLKLEQMKNMLEEIRDEVLLITGDFTKDNRVSGLHSECLNYLHDFSLENGIPLIIEADGARTLPVKAPAEHEPVIPDWCTIVINVVGLSAIGKPVDIDHVHRCDLFSELSGIPTGSLLTWEGMFKVACNTNGGLKNIPASAKRVLLLNQLDQIDTGDIPFELVDSALNLYDAVLLGSTGKSDNIGYTFEKTAAIILAAGESKRYGKPKALLNWYGKSFIRTLADLVIQAGLDPVVIVLGAVVDSIKSELECLPVKLVINENWQKGQGSSVAAGIRALPPHIGSAIFLLCDQPHIKTELLVSMKTFHSRHRTPILYPEFAGKRANPVLFDQITFDDLLTLKNETGGRSLFSRFQATGFPWPDPSILIDVDTQEDYQKLLQLEP